ncbi:thioredoxin family protein [Nonlabens ponticola]|uniref:Thioredoxin n=1 Tax=Nonlabens ponticola TaxID=2496866 RepID=A0A3S9MUU3_9FLAO|nr:thioredoxin family protein [Nonlabens ponticola]AZQ42923.1 thioredoxin [Nonlabens ponticola]
MSKFGELISTNVPVLFNFFTDWNDDSTSMHPVLRDVAAAVGDKARIIKINVDKNPQLSEALRIKGLPTIIIYKNGEMKWRQSGLQDGSSLISLLNQFAR